MKLRTFADFLRRDLLAEPRNRRHGRMNCAADPPTTGVLQMLRLKMCVNSVKRHAASDGEITQEEIAMSAVYGADGTANKQWSKYTPSGSLTFIVNNPEAFGKVLPGQFIFVDLTLTTKDA